VNNYKHDLEEKGNYNEVLQINMEHPKSGRKKAIQSLLLAGVEQLPGAAAPAQTGDSTTWLSTSLRRRAEAEDDPPMEEDGARADDAAEQGGVSPLTRDSSGEASPSLGDRHREQKLQKLPSTSPQTSLHRADVILSLATMAGREEEDSSRSTRKAMKTPLRSSAERRRTTLLFPATTAGQQEQNHDRHTEPEVEKNLALIKGAPIRSNNTSNLPPEELARLMHERPAGAVHKHRRR
jgi:hypothetical protein